MILDRERGWLRWRSAQCEAGDRDVDAMSAYKAGWDDGRSNAIRASWPLAAGGLALVVAVVLLLALVITARG